MNFHTCMVMIGKRDADRRPERDFDVGEEGFGQSGEDHPAAGLAGINIGERLRQKTINVFAEVIADQERDDNRAKRPHQPVAQLDQMIDQRHPAGLKLILFGVVSHARPQALNAAGSSGFTAGCSGTPPGAAGSSNPIISGGGTATGEPSAGVPGFVPLSSK